MLKRTEYKQLVYTLPTRYSLIVFSTLVIAPPGLSVVNVEGLVALGEDMVLCVFELLDFLQGRLLSYRYEVTRSIPPFTQKSLPSAGEYCAIHHPGKEKLYWYDSQPHPNDPSLASTHPHHKHVPPEPSVPEARRSGIKHHRIPAPGLSFDQPNLPFLIEEIEVLLQQS